MRVTVMDIAKAAGVSQPTVSQILNDKGHLFKETTRRRVEAAARKLGYLPNASARAMAHQRVTAIGLLGSTDSVRSVNAFFLPGIHDVLDAQDMHLTVARLPDQMLTNRDFVPHILREFSVGGFLISYTHEVPGQLEELLDRYRIPAVWLNRKRDFDCVYPDDRGAGRRATEYLLSLGHRKIAYLTYSIGPHFSHEDRYQGYADAMRAVGLTPMDLRSDHYLQAHELAGHDARWVRSSARPTAVVCYESRDSVTALMAATMTGLRVPRDLSVVQISDRVTPAHWHSVTTEVIPFRAMGARAVDMLLERIAHPARHQPAAVLPHELQEGNTSGPCLM